MSAFKAAQALALAHVPLNRTLAADSLVSFLPRRLLQTLSDFPSKLELDTATRLCRGCLLSRWEGGMLLWGGGQGGLETCSSYLT